jgi:hypothetical protein
MVGYPLVAHDYGFLSWLFYFVKNKKVCYFLSNAVGVNALVQDWNSLSMFQTFLSKKPRWKCSRVLSSIFDLWCISCMCSCIPSVLGEVICILFRLRNDVTSLLPLLLVIFTWCTNYYLPSFATKELLELFFHTRRGGISLKPSFFIHTEVCSCVQNASQLCCNGSIYPSIPV